MSETEILRLGASLERSSGHPLAAAIVAAARERKIVMTDPTAFASLTGKGVRCDVGGRAVALGNAKFLDELGVKSTDLAAKADALRAEGATALFLAVDGTAAAVIAIADPIKATTAAALEALRADGLRVVMLTGDNRTPETLHVFTGDVPAKPTEGVVLTDDWCTPDAKGMSHCLNQVKFPDGRIVVLKHDHMMHMIPCIVPGDHAWFVKGAAAPMKMP